LRVARRAGLDRPEPRSPLELVPPVTGGPVRSSAVRRERGRPRAGPAGRGPAEVAEAWLTGSEGGCRYPLPSASERLGRTRAEPAAAGRRKREAASATLS